MIENRGTGTQEERKTLANSLVAFYLVSNNGNLIFEVTIKVRK
jgi:hypothetical protein